MDTIERDELRGLLAHDPTTRVVMVLGRRRFAQAHIPGSETFGDIHEAFDRLSTDEDIVVYCTGEHCSASAWAAHLLASRGYRRVRRYAGGLSDWHAAGLPLASGDAATTTRSGTVRRDAETNAPLAEEVAV